MPQRGEGEENLGESPIAPLMILTLVELVQDLLFQKYLILLLQAKKERSHLREKSAIALILNLSDD
ncbi:hypothetical protein [Microcoleus sp. F4-D5]|uniref:hypothetical protein n=1 Tax=Microcoleus sp. F4-D5 TaxID=2818760 RepID=UPI002FCE9835